MNGLYISNVPALYREDLRNALKERLGLRILHYADNPMFRSFLGKTYIRGLDRFLDETRPELVITSEFSPVTLQFLRRRSRYGYRLVSLCDDSLNMIRGNDFSLTHRLARPLVLRKEDDLILHSPDVRDWYRQHYGKGLWMPIIADERRIRPALERVLPMSESLRLSEKPVVAFVGRFVGLKNIPTLVKAFEPLRDRAQLVLIGDGPDREKLARMAPYAHFTGWLTGDDLLAWYNLIDILVLPSTREAYGAVTGEALMAGAKVIVSDRAGSTSLVREGENGYIVNPLDSDGLTHRMAALLETVNPGRRIVLRANLLPYRFEDCISSLIHSLSR